MVEDARRVTSSSSGVISGASGLDLPSTEPLVHEATNLNKAGTTLSHLRGCANYDVLQCYQRTPAAEHQHGIHIPTAFRSRALTMLQVDSQTRPRRAGHQKSKNGCLTCKIRRVKCDETVPHCRRCTQTGRKCEGPGKNHVQFIYSHQDSSSSASSARLEASVLTPPRPEAERQTFHFFISFAAPLFAGVVDDRFWKELVPQLAQTYEFVWDSVISLSALLEIVQRTPSSTASDSPNALEIPNRQHRQALRLYNRAISSLRHLAARGQLDDSIIALSYILFSSVEFQQWNVETGIQLLRRCCSISVENMLNDYPTTNSTSSITVHQVVTPFVLRKAVLTATLGCALPLQRPPDDETAEILSMALYRSSALAEARSQLYPLLNDSYELIRLAEFMPQIDDSHPVKKTFTSDRISLMQRLMQWKTSTVDISTSPHDPEIDWIFSYLVMYWAVCYIYLATCISTRQTLFDEHIDRFAELVGHAQTYLRHTSSSARIQLLAGIGPGALPPLYFCAMKCRDPRLRREAQRLMRLAPLHGNDWAFVEPDRVIAKIISLEEGERQDQAEPLEPGSITGHYAGLPPEERRFAFVSVVGRRAPGGRLRHALELSRFEDTAAGGPGRRVSDYVWLNSEDI